MRSGGLLRLGDSLSDAIVIFEVLSDDTPTNDRVIKLIDYANVSSSRCYTTTR